MQYQFLRIKDHFKQRDTPCLFARDIPRERVGGLPFSPVGGTDNRPWQGSL